MVKKKPKPAKTKKKPARKMPTFSPPPADLVTRFQEATSNLQDAEPRKMFRFPAVFVHGNMFASLFNVSLIVRLPAHEREAMSVLGGRPFEPMPGRPMREYVAVPDAIVRSHTDLIGWLTKARAYAETLPAKSKGDSPKARTKRKS
jgi:TfoX/Sxy family transcriptional regulator of competence genes